MKDVIEEVDRWVARGDRVALATVVGVKRSAPRPPGLQDGHQLEQGEVSGAVSGGCVEGAVVEVAEEVLRAASRGCCTTASPTPTRGTSACRAAARSTSSWSATSRERAARLRGASPARAAARALVTVLAGATPARRMLIRADGAREGTLGDEALDARRSTHAEELMWAERSELREGASLFVDVTSPPPRLIVFGAVDYAAIAVHARARDRLAAVRRRPARALRHPRALPGRRRGRRRVAAEAFERLGGIDRATYIAVLTHDPKLDDDALKLALDSERRLHRRDGLAAARRPAAASG